MNIFKRGIATLFVIAMLFVPVLSGITASASGYSYDVDFTIKPEKTEVETGDSFNVDIIITTRKSGYVAFEFNLNYNESLVSCETAMYDQDGYTGDGTAEGIFTLKYEDPSSGENPKPTAKDSDHTISISFKANTGLSSDSSVEFKGEIKKLNGVNALDGYKITNLTPANLTSKKVSIKLGENNDVESEIFESTDPIDIDDPIDPIITPDPITANTTEKKDNTLTIVLIIICGIVVFGAGAVTGYMVCLRKTNGRHDRDDDFMDSEPPQRNLRRSSPPSQRFSERDSEYTPPQDRRTSGSGHFNNNSYAPPSSRANFGNESSYPQYPNQTPQRPYQPQNQPIPPQQQRTQYPESTPQYGAPRQNPQSNQGSGYFNNPSQPRQGGYPASGGNQSNSVPKPNGYTPSGGNSYRPSGTGPGTDNPAKPPQNRPPFPPYNQ